MVLEPPIPADLWEQTPATAQAALRVLLQQQEQRLQALQQQVRELQQQIRDLQHRLNQNSTNSSRPPSTDPPSVKRSPPRASSGRLPGGQPGHALQRRPWLPPGHTIICKP